MFSTTKLAFALTTMVSLAAARLPQPPAGSVLPSTIIIYVINSTTGTNLGSLNGYGNFSSPGPAFPFRVYSNGAGLQTINGYDTCTVDGILACGGEVGTLGGFYASGGDVALLATGTLFSVDAVTDVAGGLNGFGLPYGIPVYLGDVAAIPVTLQAVAASG